MHTDTTFTGNVRLENIGAVPISSHSAIPTMISYHWHTANGELAVFDGHRTPLPIELLTGRQITVPMKLETPKEPGDYCLELTMVQEGECWLDENAKQIPIKVTAEPLPDLTIGWNISNEPTSSYGEDHKKSIDLLHARLQETGRSRFTLLEIGGNVHPTLFHFNGDLYNVDIDIHSMQIGAMLNKHWSKEVNFICADATALPFPDGMFDAIILCSALHHFPDVRKLLRSLSRKLRPCGFIATLSEPIGHYYGTNISSDLLRELAKGINEQTFTLEEYANIFQAAGLKAEVIADQGSLKAFLTIPQ